MNESLRGMAAKHMLFLFLVSNGFPPPPEDDYEELHLGEHIVWIAGVHISDRVDQNVVWDKLNKYCVDQASAVAPFFRFNAYSVRAYDCEHCGGTHLYVAIYQ